jgi:hypothetical protein
LILTELNLRHLKAGTKVILLLDFAVLSEVALRCTFWTLALLKVANTFVQADTGNEPVLRIRDNLSRIPDPDPTIAPSRIRIPDPGSGG